MSSPFASISLFGFFFCLFFDGSDQSGATQSPLPPFPVYPSAFPNQTGCLIPSVAPAAASPSSSSLFESLSSRPPQLLVSGNTFHLQLTPSLSRHIGGGPSLSQPSWTGSEWISDRGLDCQILVTKFARFHPLLVDFTLNFFLNSELRDRNSTRCPD